MEKINNPGIIAADTIAENEIISRLLTGEKDLYAILVRRYNQRLYRVGMSIINDDAEVEDAMQVAYTKAYENLEKFAFKSSFSTWLTRILINESLLRIKKRKQFLNLNDDMFENEMHHQSPGTSQTPLMKIVNTELKEALEKAICQLPEKYRTVFVMREIEDMNVSETQECLDLTEVNVKVRLNRAKVMLQKSLSAFYKKEDLLHFHLSRCNKITEYVMIQIEKA
ncbi:MAG: sigma-70 family RNA polymerase sigma factor [Ferruginibacter sp.]